MIWFKIAAAGIGAGLGMQGALHLACDISWLEPHLCGSTPVALVSVSLGAIAGGALGWLTVPLLSVLDRKIKEGSPAGEALLFAMAALGGLWTVVLIDGHARYQNWYWGLMIPLLVVQSALFGYLSPKRAWLWGAAPLFGQWLWQIIAHSDQIGIGNLGPFAHLVVLGQYALTAIPCILAAEIAAYASRRQSAGAKT